MKRKIFYKTMFAVLVMFVTGCGAKAASDSHVKSTSADDAQIPADVVQEMNESLAFIDMLLGDAPRATQESVDKGTDFAGMSRTDPKEMEALYATADSTWRVFRTMCSKGQYKKAWDYYYEKKETEQYFFLALRTTTSQYEFFKNVLATLDKVYDYDNSLEKTSHNLDLVLVNTGVVFAMHYNKEGDYIPPHYEELFFTCLALHKMKGDNNEIQEIIAEYGPDMCKIRNISEKDFKQETEAFLRRMEKEKE